MKLETSTLMMLFFLLVLFISIWKIYVFLPKKELLDDDRTKESQDELLKITLHVIESSDGNLSVAELFKEIKEHSSFDKNHYWRFNQNRLNQLLSSYYLKYPHTKSIADIYNDLK